MLPFWIALQFLSSLPIRLPGMPRPEELGRSLLFYPLVGLLFGVLLWLLNVLLAGVPLLVHAALLLTAWVLLSGPIAVVVLVVVLLLKFAALVALIEQQQGVALLLAPLIGRAALLGLFLCTPYVRAGGLGQALADLLPRLAGRQVLGLSVLACLLLGGYSGAWAVLLAGLLFFWLRQVMLRRLGGTTGDTAGALLELLETAVLLGVVLF